VPSLPTGGFLAAAALTAGVSIAAVVAAVSTTDDAPAAAPSPTTTSVASDGDTAVGMAAPLAATIVDFAFQPEPITVAVGQEVTWTNDDPFAHTVKAVDGSFDSGRLDEGVAFSTTFATPGSYAYLCGIHNSMTGTVVVEP
jgi:plastocyanin